MLGRSSVVSLSLLVATTLAGALFLWTQARPSADEATTTAAKSIELQVYPSSLSLNSTLTSITALSVKPTGFTGPITLAVSGLPSEIPTTGITNRAFLNGSPGYYCSSHCQAAAHTDFPITLDGTNGQWVSIGPTLTADPDRMTPGSTFTVTITASADGVASVSKSIAVTYLGNDGSAAYDHSYVQPYDPDFTAHLYKLQLSAGQSKAVTATYFYAGAMFIGEAPVSVRSNVDSGGVSGMSSSPTGLFDATSFTFDTGTDEDLEGLGEGEGFPSPSANRTLTIGTSSSTRNGTYELILGSAMPDGSVASPLGVSVVVSGGTSGPALSTSASSATVASEPETVVSTSATQSVASSGTEDPGTEAVTSDSTDSSAPAQSTKANTAPAQISDVDTAPSGSALTVEAGTITPEVSAFAVRSPSRAGWLWLSAGFCVIVGSLWLWWHRRHHRST
ncbi:hypothetical protein HY374_01045 [Candidatus Berkelbacteria bacterium]|nr:hypothetical protein [Candidatus Berkelbacteria bacterium]